MSQNKEQFWLATLFDLTLLHLFYEQDLKSLKRYPMFSLPHNATEGKTK